nr:RecName: Full=Monodehydroascorbate reductase II; Short=MDARII; Short=MRII; AltName: Full=Ascorbate free radical reductase II; Short=AFR reductase II [Glycine max]AAB20624.1 monodehydroascorbate reductase II, MRII [Glycine max=soybeans, Merrill, root nodules, Peptide Partial, 10 aa] [Glycine max]
AKTFKYIILG